MVNYKEILRLASEGTSQSQIAASFRSSRNKVNEAITVAKNAGISCPLDESVTDEQIEAILFFERYSAVSMYLDPDYLYIHTELAMCGVTLILLWKEYCDCCSGTEIARSANVMNDNAIPVGL